MEYLIEEIDDLPINDEPVTSEEEKLDVIINNVTSSFETGCQFDFNKVPLKYVTIGAAQQVATLKIDKCVILVRSTKKLLCVKAPSEDQALSAAKKSIEILKSWGINATFNNYKVLSLSCSCLLPWKVHIKAMVIKYHNDFEFKSNHCMMKLRKKRGCLEIYPSGFVQVVGHSTKSVLNMLEKGLPFFSQFRI